MALPQIQAYPIPDVQTANRAPWQIDAARTALLIHDMQNYFVDAFPVNQSPIEPAMANMIVLQNLAHQLGIPVFFSAQPGDQDPAERGLLSDIWGPGMRNGTAPEIVAALQPQANDVVITKWRYSAFQRTDLAEQLRAAGRDQLIICGVYAHLGCLLTASEAFMQDIAPFFVADAVADFSLEDHILALEYAAKRCAVVITTNELMRELGLARLRHELADLLDDVEELGPDDNLLDWGLDSVRLMTVAERWHAAGVDIDFAELAATPTLAAWYERRFVSAGLEPSHG